MVQRLILDTGILLAVERGRIALDAVADDADDVVIASVTAAELLLGVELADATRRDKRQQFVDDVLTLIPVEDYTLDVARVHARLLAHIRRAGTPRGAHGLLIAATAAATTRTVVTADATAHFGELPGVRSRLVPETP